MRLDFKNAFAPYKGRIAGVLVAAVICVLIFTIGFWATLLIGAIVAVGYFIGKAADNGNNVGGRVLSLIDKILPGRFK